MYLENKIKAKCIIEENLNSKLSQNQLDTYNSNILYIFMKQNIFVNYNTNIFLRFYK